MLEEETNNSSLLASLQTHLPPVPSETPPVPPLPFITPAPTITAASVETLASAFTDLSAKVQLNSIINHKWKSPIYSSYDTSLEGRDNGSDLPNENIPALVADLSNSSDTPMDDPK